MTLDPSLARELAPTGPLRASLNLANLVLAHSNTSAHKPAGVTIDLARELARRLGVGVEFLGWQTPGESVKALADGAADIGFLAVDPKRAEQVAFTAPYVQIEACYQVREGSPLRDWSEVDRAGTEVLVMETSAYDLYLTRVLKRAKLVRMPQAQVVPTLLADTTGRRVAAGIKQALLEDMKATPGLRLLDGYFLGVEQAMVLQRTASAAARAAVHAFLQEMVDSGFIAGSLARHAIEGATVLPVR